MRNRAPAGRPHPKRLLGPGRAGRGDGRRRGLRPAGGVADARLHRLPAQRGGRHEDRQDLQRPRPGDLCRCAAAARPVLPGSPAGRRRSVRGSWTGARPPDTRASRSATTSATVTSTTRASSRSSSTARLWRAGVRPPVGPARLAPAAALDGPVAGRHARRDPPVGSRPGCSRADRPRRSGQRPSRSARRDRVRRGAWSRGCQQSLTAGRVRSLPPAAAH